MKPITRIFALSLALSTLPAHAGNIVLENCNRFVSLGEIKSEFLTQYQSICGGTFCQELTNEARLQTKLTQVLADQNVNPRLQMRVATFVKNYPGFPEAMKTQAKAVIARINQDPALRSIKADLAELEKTSLFYINESEVFEQTLNQVYKKFDQMSNNVAMGRGAGNQVYTEVIPDAVVQKLSAQHESIDVIDKAYRKLLKDFSGTGSRNPGLYTDNILEQTKVLLDPSSGIDMGSGLQLKLQESSDFITQLKQSNYTNVDLAKLTNLKKYYETFQTKQKEFLKRADQEFVELTNDTPHAEKVYLRDIFKGLMAGKKNGIEAFVDFRNWVGQYTTESYSIQLFGRSIEFPFLNGLFRRADTVSKLVQDLVFGKVDHGYVRGTSVAMGNDGVTEFIKKQLLTDAPLRRMAVDFYMELEKLTPLDKKTSHPYTFWEKTDKDIWQLALNSTRKSAAEKASPLHAMRILNVFGHNDFVENFNIGAADLASLGSEAERKAVLEDFALLNHLRPGRNSPLYAPGAIPALNLPQTMLDEMNGFQVQLKKYYELYPSLYHDAYMQDFVALKMFRSGYYHFYGGTYVTSEFMANQQSRILGLNLPVTLSFAMGYYYKMITMEQTYLDAAGKFLFRQMNYRTRTTMSEVDLKKFLDKVNEKRTEQNLAAWSIDELRVNKLSLDINLLHLDITAYQHVRGADWAYDTLRGF